MSSAAHPTPSFFDTYDCRSGRHCATCRSRAAGHPFRSAIASYFHLPSADWDCPHSRPWDLDHPAQPILPPAPATQAPSPLLSARAAALLAACRACDHFNGNVCELAFPSGCCRTKWQEFLAAGACHMPLINPQ